MSLVFLYEVIFIYFNFNKYIINNTVSIKEHNANVKDTIKTSWNLQIKKYVLVQYRITL